MKCERGCGKELIREDVVIGGQYPLGIFYCEDCGIEWCRDGKNYVFRKGEVY